MVVVAVMRQLCACCYCGVAGFSWVFLCGHCVLLDVFLCFPVYLLLVYWSLLILASV